MHLASGYLGLVPACLPSIAKLALGEEADVRWACSRALPPRQTFWSMDINRLALAGPFPVGTYRSLTSTIFR